MAEFWDMQFKDWLSVAILVATIVAIYYGPIRAVEVSRNNEKEDGKRERKLSVFHNLMKTRKFQLSPDHVSALNLIQLEFYGEDKVQQSYKTYMGILNGAWPKGDDPALARHEEAREAALYDLIHDIGEVLDFKMDKQELKRLGYGPQGWETDETQARAVRHYLVEVLSGKRGLPIIDYAKTVHIGGKFPPPP